MVPVRSLTAGGLALLLASLGAGCSTQPPERPRVTLVTGGSVFTSSSAQPWAEAFAFDATGKILAVGSEAEVAERVAAELVGFEDFDEVVELDGELVTPGFVDAHLHVPEAGINEDLCLLPSGGSLDDYTALVARCARDVPAGEWVRAAGASLFDLRGTSPSPLDALDRAVPNHPVVVLDDLGHAAWGNTAGLAAAGIDPASPDPQGGVLERDPVTGRLTGLLLEDAQQSLRNAAAPSAEVIDRGLAVALDELARHGVTSVGDVGGYWQQGHTDAWTRAEAAGALTVRAANALYVYPSMDVEEQLAELEARFRDDPDARLRVNTAKVYVDGILDLGTASLLSPYDVPPDPRFPSGFTYFSDEQLREYTARLHALGFRISFHVIGDAAVRRALDAIEAIPAPANEIAARHHRLTHVYLVDAADVPRFAELGVVADLQVGTEAISQEYHEHLREYLGDRARDLIPVDDLLASGALTILSSDWDADELSPLGIVSRSLTRYSHAVPSVETAVRMLTVDAATAMGLAEVTGSIEVGKQADFVVLSDDVFALEPAEIEDVEVVSTWVGGVEVFVEDE